MIVDMPATSTQQLNRKLVELREQSGVLAQGRILTFVVVTDDSTNTEDAIESAIEASRPTGSSAGTGGACPGHQTTTGASGSSIGMVIPAQASADASAP